MDTSQLAQGEDDAGYPNHIEVRNHYQRHRRFRSGTREPVELGAWRSKREVRGHKSRCGMKLQTLPYMLFVFFHRLSITLFLRLSIHLSLRHSLTLVLYRSRSPLPTHQQTYCSRHVNWDILRYYDGLFGGDDCRCLYATLG
jgi:hypothetical protein